MRPEAAATGAAYRYQHLVTFEETNVVGNVYFAHYVRWQGHCRERFLAEHAPGVLAAVGRDLTLVTVSCSMEYFDECQALDRVELSMRLVRAAGNRVEVAFDYHRRAEGRPPALVARGRQTVACMRRGDGGLEPLPVPAELAAALRPFAAGAGTAHLGNGSRAISSWGGSEV